jgi:Family of unknown function (DUF6206)
VREWLDRDGVARALTEFEQRLDPAHPEAAGAHVLAYGEISAALTLPGVEALDGLVVKRMSGFADVDAATEYQRLLNEFLDRLASVGIRTVDTLSVDIVVPGRHPTVYLLQPLLDRETLGHRLLHEADDQTLRQAVTLVLGQTVKVFAANAANPADQVSIDAQLSNWSLPVQESGDPVLIDVGTPFIRRGGKHAFDQEILLSAVPPGIRNYYRWKGTASEYMDDYFEPRLIAVDLVCNLHKEGAPKRIPTALAAANDWLAGPVRELQTLLGSGPGPEVPITEQEVSDYYRDDAATLELFLRVRRADRAVRRVFRRRYDFILPGPVQR